MRIDEPFEVCEMFGYCGSVHVKFVHASIGWPATLLLVGLEMRHQYQ